MSAEKSRTVGKGLKEVPILERHDFGPTQVKTLEEIIVGKTYVDRHRINPSFAGGKFTVTEPPYENGESQWWVKGELEAPYLEAKTKVTWRLADHGVIPYPNGTFNRSSWMEDPEKASLTEETLTR
ncbi:MAG: hypothetical protein Q8P89_00155 [bacterium]|nr:hypothetical protein [bacterium]